MQQQHGFPLEPLGLVLTPAADPASTRVKIGSAVEMLDLDGMLDEPDSGYTEVVIVPINPQILAGIEAHPQARIPAQLQARERQHGLNLSLTQTLASILSPEAHGFDPHLGPEVTRFLPTLPSLRCAFPIVVGPNTESLPRHVSKFGNQPYLLCGEEDGVICSSCHNAYTFLFQLRGEDLPDQLSGVYVPEDLEVPTALFQCWLCVPCSFGGPTCGDDWDCPKFCCRWIDASGVSASLSCLSWIPMASSSFVSSIPITDDGRYDYRHMRSDIRRTLSDTYVPPPPENWYRCIPINEFDRHNLAVLQGGGERALLGWKCLRDLPDVFMARSYWQADFYEELPHDEQDQILYTQAWTVTADKLSGFGCSGSGDLILKQCPLCGTYYELFFQFRTMERNERGSMFNHLGCAGWTQIWVCPQHRRQFHFECNFNR